MQMKRSRFIPKAGRRAAVMPFCLLCLLGAAQGWSQPRGPELSDPDKPVRTIDIEEVSVSTRRNLSEIGVTKTVLDTVVLQQNIVHSLAEVLAQNTPIFIKSYGRGAVATASFRGTSPSHTQVLWNGMKLNSPMLGMVDFSLKPSFFIDDANILHGAGSVDVAGGGLGGAITLGTYPTDKKGFDLNFVQGISSFDTYDDYLRLTYGGPKVQLSTRFCYGKSDNDFKYTNYNKLNEDLVTHPVERNKNCSFRDLHVMQEVYWKLDDRNKFNAAVWFLDSNRGIPALNVNYQEDDRSNNRQDESTLRAVAGWDRLDEKLQLGAKAGYTYSNMVYHSQGTVNGADTNQGGAIAVEQVHSQSIVHSGFLNFSARYFPNRKLVLSASLSTSLHAVDSRDKYIYALEKKNYDTMRLETSVLVSAKYRPHPRIGLGVDLREESYGDRMTPLIPAGFVDVVLWPKYNVVVKGSVARNYRHPTMNDLYFQPGGNDTLRPEKGYTYEGGLEFALRRKGFSFEGEGAVYNSRIQDWILWLPTFKGYWSPINVRKVHSYGVELKGKMNIVLGRGWTLFFDASWAYTRSINQGDPMSENDQAIGKQLVYVPEFSSTVTGRLSWRGYSLTYKYNHYSERYTTSSNDPSTLYHLGAYYMSDLYLEKGLRTKLADLSLKFCIYNLFNEEYESVLARPMPRQNYGFFIGIRPNFGRGK